MEGRLKEYDELDLKSIRRSLKQNRLHLKKITTDETLQAGTPLTILSYLTFITWSVLEITKVIR